MKTYTLVLGAIILVLLIIIIILSVRQKHGTKEKEMLDIFTKLNSYMTDAIRAPKLEPGGTVRVYVSAGMFDMSDTLYAVGIQGILPGIKYQSINLVDMICNLKPGQFKELQRLSVLFDVPEYGIVGEIEKMGWECYCPIRDGLTMATIASAISDSTLEQILQPYKAGDPISSSWKDSLFNPTQLAKLGLKTEQQKIAYARGIMLGALGTCVGANDLYNMYATCNCCIMNYNGLEPDAGAVAEIGQLGARGVPAVILKGSINGDFSGVTNPMPVMATTSKYNLFAHLTDNPGSVFNTPSSVVSVTSDRRGALPFLKEKVNRFIKAQGENNPDAMSFGNYNSVMPLPPLQIFWTALGSTGYFLKHREKSIRTQPTGFTDFKKDYTQFWYNNVVNGGKPGLVQVGKAFADNLNVFVNKPEFKNIDKYWA